MKHKPQWKGKRIHAADAGFAEIHGEPCDDVQIEAAAADADGKESLPKFKILAYNGGPLSVDRYDAPVILDIGGITFAKQITANSHHDKKNIVGHVTEHAVDGKHIHLSGIVSGTGEAAKEVVANARNGYPWRASIEAVPTKRMKTVAAGEKVQVNGQTFVGPCYVAAKSRLYGIAFVPRGADEDTKVSIAAEAAGFSTKERDMEFEQWVKDQLGLDPAGLTDEQKQALMKVYDAMMQEAAGPEGSEAEENKPQQPAPAMAAEMAFDVDDIKASASLHNETLESIYAEYEGEIPRDKLLAIKANAAKETKELKVKALRERWATPAFEAQLMLAQARTNLALVRAPRPQGPAIHASSHDADGEVIEAAMAQTLGIPNIEEHYGEQALESAHKQFRRGIGLQQVMIMAAEENGMTGQRLFRINASNIRDVLRYAFGPPIHAASTLSLPGILSNVANKELLEGFQLGEQYEVWREISRIKPVNDFKAVTSYRLNDNMEYEQVGGDGLIKHGKLSEESYTRQARTYAKMFVLSRESIINDDLGALDDLRTRLGAGSARKFTNLFWTTFLNNASFFTAGRGNYITGSTTTLLNDGVGLQLAINAFKALETAEGQRAGGTPTILLHPPEVNVAAMQLYADVSPNQASQVNVYARKYKPVESIWLSDSGITNYSTTAWYLLQDPRILPAVVVSFLNGQESPTVESADADFDTLGVQFRGFHDFGVDLAEYLAGVKSKGAA